MLVVAGCDGAELFEFTKEPLDKVPFPVKSEGCFPLGCSVAFGWDDHGNPALFQPIDQLVCVIRPVGEEGVWIDVFEHRFRLTDIRILFRCDVDLHRVPDGIADAMDLCGQSAPGLKVCFVLAIRFALRAAANNHFPPVLVGA